MFTSKLEAYSYAIHILRELHSLLKDNQLLTAINLIRIQIANHQQDPNVVARILISSCNSIESRRTQQWIEHICDKIINSHYDQQTLDKRIANPLGRYLESQLQISLLQNPSIEIMSAVNAVSIKIICALRSLQPDNYYLLNYFRSFLNKSDLDFGAFGKKVTIEEIIDVLESNKPVDLARIMQIHFVFARKIMRKEDFTHIPERREPTGKMAHIIREMGFSELINFFKKFDSGKTAFIANNVFYGAMFFSDNGRTRGVVCPKKSNTQMGIMQQTGGFFGVGLPHAARAWRIPDSQYQIADTNSPFVQNTVNNDTVYIAGPSGMTTLFLTLMSLFANFDSRQEKQLYLAAVSAYMISGGYHSLHEILAAAHHILDLTPGYHTGEPKNSANAPANFHVFYQTLIDIDPNIDNTLSEGWLRYEHFFSHHYLPSRGPLNTLTDPSTLGQMAIELCQYRIFSSSRPHMEFLDGNRKINQSFLLYQSLFANCTSDFERYFILYTLITAKDSAREFISHTLKKLCATLWPTALDDKEKIKAKLLNRMSQLSDERCDKSTLSRFIDDIDTMTTSGILLACVSSEILSNLRDSFKIFDKSDSQVTAGYHMA